MNYGNNMNYTTNANAFQSNNNMAAKFNTNTNPSMQLNMNMPMNQGIGINSSIAMNPNMQMQYNQQNISSNNVPTSYNPQINPNAYATTNTQLNPQLNKNNPPINSFQSPNMQYDQLKPNINRNQDQINLNQFMTAPLAQSQSLQSRPQHQPPPVNQSQSIQRPKIKERLYLKLTNEERGFFSNLFEIADIDKKGKLTGKIAAEFLRKSSLPKEALKQIWYIASQTDPNQLERDEFYIALRLVGLAQNNMPITVEAIKNNAPIPPLPVFNLKKDASSTQVEDTDSTFALNDGDIQKYTRFFNTSKEQDNRLSIQKACQMWKSTNVNEETISKILMIVSPLKENGFLDLKEFIVCTLIVFKSFHREIPKTLPKTLATYLYGDYKKDTAPINQFSPNQHVQSPQQIQQSIELGQGQFPLNPGNQMQASLGINPSDQNIGMNKGISQPPQIIQAPIVVPHQEVFSQTEQDLFLVTGLVEEIEKITKSTEDTKSRNDSLKQQIKEIYDKLKTLKSNFIKMTLMIPQRQNEIEIAQEELNKMKATYFNTMDEKGQLEIEYMKEKERITKSREEGNELNIQKQKEKEINATEYNLMQAQEQNNQKIKTANIILPDSNTVQEEMQYGAKMNCMETQPKDKLEDNFDPYSFLEPNIAKQEGGGQMNIPMSYQNPQSIYNLSSNDQNMNDHLKQNNNIPDSSFKPIPGFQFNDQQYNNPQQPFGQGNNFGLGIDPIQNQYAIISPICKQSYPSLDTINQVENAERNKPIRNPFQNANTNNNNADFGFGDDYSNKYGANFEERKNAQKDDDWDF